MQIVAFHKGEQNDAAFDPWSLVHMASGLALGLMGFSLKQSMVAAKRPRSQPTFGHQLGTHWNEG